MICPETIGTCYIDNWDGIFQLLSLGLILGTLIGTLAGRFAKAIKARKGY